MKKKLMSIVVPCYNEQESLPIFYEEIKKIEKEMNYVDFEYIFVNDGSRDRTLEIARSLAKKDKKVRYISFSRNFGKEAAMYAGIEKSTAKYTAIIDADLQQNPKYLVEMLEFLEKNEEYDEVAMVNKDRSNYKGIGKWATRTFYKLMNSLSDVKFEEDASDFRMFRSYVRTAILKLSEKNRFTKGIFGYIGFKIKCIPYKVEERNSGKSKFNLRKTLSYGVDGIVGYSIKPLKIATVMGFITSILGFIYLIYLIIKTIVVGIETPGFATIVCLILFIGGIELLCIGILGEYISKVFVETKNRPIYLEKNSLGFEDDIL